MMPPPESSVEGDSTAQMTDWTWNEYVFDHWRKVDETHCRCGINRSANCGRYFGHVDSKPVDFDVSSLQ